MHTWHRWLSVIFGIFMLRIAVTGTGSFAGVFHPLHSGESLGPPSAPPSRCSRAWRSSSFSASGIWLYMQMWRNRAARIVTPRWFWK
ncbi:hypothetical protein ACFSTD_18745 [Novosphingobium colocasiae]